MARNTAFVLLAFFASAALAKETASTKGSAKEETASTKGGAKARKPLITTDILFSTYELLSDISDTAYTSLLASHVGKHSPTVQAHVDKALDFACAKAQLKKADIWAKLEVAKASVDDVKANIAAQKEVAHEKLNVVAAKVVDAFEKALPHFAGLLPRTIGDLVLSGLYFAFILHVLFHLVLNTLRFVLKMFCFFCCCGFCRRGKSVEAKTGKAGKVKGPAQTPPQNKPSSGGKKK